MCRTCRLVTQVYTCHGGLLHQSTCHLHQVFLLMLSSPSPPSPDRPQCVMFPSLCPCVLIVQLPLMSENMWCLVSCSFVSLLKMMISSFIHVPVKDMNSYFFMAAYYSMMYHWQAFGLVPTFCYCEQYFKKKTYVCMCLHSRMIYNPLGIYTIMGLLGEMVFFVEDQKMYAYIYY